MSSRSSTGDRRVVVGLAAIAVVTCLLLVLGVTPELWVDNTGQKASSWRWRLSVALAGGAVIFLSATLALGPIRVLLGRPPATHLPWRRVIGVAGALLAMAHLLIGLSIHGRLLSPLGQFFTATPTLEDPFTIRRGARGYANWLGFGASFVLMTLVVLSRSSWLRRLGSVRWKLVQRSLYLAFGAVALHAFLYWRVERRLLLHQVLVLSPMAVAAGLQALAAGVVLARRRPR